MIYNMMIFKKRRKTMTPKKITGVVTLVMFLACASIAGAFFGIGGGGKGKVEVGSLAPEFSGNDLENKNIEYSAYRGNSVVLLDFWSIYCASCVEEMPKLIEIYNDLKDQGLVMLGINMDSFGTRRVVKFIQGLEYKIPYPVIIDKKRTIATAFNAMVLPTTIVIDSSGQITMYHVGYKSGDEKHIRDAIESSLQKLKRAERKR
jgi:peroxiredoxin